MQVLDINAYDFYLKDNAKNLLKKNWKSIYYDEDSGLYYAFPIYKDKNKRPLVFCRLCWYGSKEPLRISVYTEDNNFYSTFLNERYDSSKYMQSLHINILKQLNKYQIKAKPKKKGK